MDVTANSEKSVVQTRHGIGTRVGAFARDNAFPLTVFVVMRVWTLVWASVVAAFVLSSAEVTKQYDGVVQLHDAIIAPWQRWDTIWYSKIALEGYIADERVVFAPLFPLLIRIISPLTGNNTVAAGLLISSVAALVCFVLLYRLAREMFGEDAARRTLIFLAAFPTAFYLFAAYTESLFLACMLGAFVLMRRQRWLAASVLGALAALTRAQGAFLLLPLAAEFWMQYRRGDISSRHISFLGLVGIGSLGHLLWLTLQFGSLDAWFQAQLMWHRALPPWQTIGEVWNAIARAPSPLDAGLSGVQAVAELLLFITLVWSARRLPLAFTLYVAILAIPPLFLVTTYSSQFPLVAVTRYVLVAFPLFLLLGALPYRVWQLPVMAFGFMAQAFWMMLFVAWVFVH